MEIVNNVVEKNSGSDDYLYIGEVLVESGALQEVEKSICFKGGKIHQVTNRADARAILENISIKAVLIDQYLDAGSGIDAMLWLHGFSPVPAIVIVMNMSPVDVIVALEAGASDAVYANVYPRELVARINASIRKYDKMQANALFDEFSASTRPALSHDRTPLYFSPQSKRLYFSDTSRYVLHGKEADMLELLIHKYPEYIDREKISRVIFQREWHPSDRSIDNLVSRLRKILDGDGNNISDSIIETVRNEGYRLRSPVSLLPLEKKMVRRSKDNARIL